MIKAKCVTQRNSGIQRIIFMTKSGTGYSAHHLHDQEWHRVFDQGWHLVFTSHAPVFCESPLSPDRRHQGPSSRVAAELRPRLFDDLGGAIRDEGDKALAIGGVENHLHPWQEAHPRRVSFEEEFRALLRAHDIDWEERYFLK